GGARVDERLDEHRHRGVGRREAVIVHVAARVRGPQRGPACAHRGQERRLVRDAEKALELSGEVRALAVLDEGGRAHRRGRAAVGPTRSRSVDAALLNGMTKGVSLMWPAGALSGTGENALAPRGVYFT